MAKRHEEFITFESGSFFALKKTNPKRRSFKDFFLIRKISLLQSHQWR